MPEAAATARRGIDAWGCGNSREQYHVARGNLLEGLGPGVKGARELPRHNRDMCGLNTPRLRKCCLWLAQVGSLIHIFAREFQLDEIAGDAQRPRAARRMRSGGPVFRDDRVAGPENQRLYQGRVLRRAVDRQIALERARLEEPRFGRLHGRQRGCLAAGVFVYPDAQIDLVWIRVFLERGGQSYTGIRRRHFQLIDITPLPFVVLREDRRPRCVWPWRRPTVGGIIPDHGGGRGRGLWSAWEGDRKHRAGLTRPCKRMDRLC